MHNRIAELTALGYGRNEVAQATGYSTARVSTILGDPRIRARINEMQRTMESAANRTVERQIEDLAEPALKNIEQTVKAVIDPADRAKVHQDNVSFRILESTIPMLSRSAEGRAGKGNRLTLEGEVVDRLFTAINRSEKAEELNPGLEVKQVASGSG